MESKLSRRYLLEQSAAFGVFALVGATACGKEKKALVCTDTTGLVPGDLQIRAALAYVDVSTEPGKNCTGCQQFLPASPDVCGGCKIIKGPINPGGYCKSFFAKQAT